MNGANNIITETCPPIIPIIKRKKRKKAEKNQDINSEVIVEEKENKKNIKMEKTPDRQRKLLNFFTKIEKRESHLFGFKVGQFTPIHVNPGTTVNLDIVRTRQFDIVSFDFQIRNSTISMLVSTIDHWKNTKYQAQIIIESLEKSHRFKLKFFKFFENFRRPYYGTWSKTSRSVKGRKPFAHDENLDYDVESDLEWEDEEPGDDVSSTVSNEDHEETDGSADSNDSFLVPHGYLSGDEGIKDSEDENEKQVENMDKVITKEATSQFKRLKPIVIYSPCANNECICPNDIFIRRIRRISYSTQICEDVDPANNSFLNQSIECDQTKHIKGFPEFALPVLINLVHNNIGIKKLVYEFTCLFEKEFPDNKKISKNAIMRKIQEITVIKSRKYIVLDKYLNQFAPHLFLKEH